VAKKMNQVLLISIGSELLSGQTVNTNASFLAKELTQLGFNVQKIIAIPDSENEVVLEVKKAISEKKFRLIIITGGLGPTWDDSTSKFLAGALDVPLTLNEKALSIVKRRYNELYSEGLVTTTEITSAREKMAYLPEGAKPIDNPVGTAPGIQFKTVDGYSLILCFPGVPNEMKAMFQESTSDLLSLLKQEETHYFETEVITPFTDESLLAPLLEEIRENFDVWIKSLPTTYQEEKNIRLIISSYGKSTETVKTVVLKAQEALLSLFSKY
jgi:molybdenum cofactor synthesis domain-containing protein